MKFMTALFALFALLLVTPAMADDTQGTALVCESRDGIQIIDTIKEKKPLRSMGKCAIVKTAKGTKKVLKGTAKATKKVMKKTGQALKKIGSRAKYRVRKAGKRVRQFNQNRPKLRNMRPFQRLRCAGSNCR